jgi:uncharacterized RDD family membrane protein YckC
MSDVSQGAGWWIASDGKWYPPQLHPAALPPQWSGPPTWTGQQPLYPPGYGPPPGYGLPHGFGPAPGAVNPGSHPDPVLAQPLAPWWKRLVAILIDGAIITFVYVIVLFAIGAATANSSTHHTSTHQDAAQVAIGLIALWIVASIPNALYYGFMNGSRRGQTLGKMALGIAVRDARTGRPIGFWRGCGRYLLTALFAIVGLIPFVLDSLAPLWSSRLQAWHDRATHTVVVDLTS